MTQELDALLVIKQLKISKYVILKAKNACIIKVNAVCNLKSTNRGYTKGQSSNIPVTRI